METFEKIDPEVSSPLSQLSSFLLFASYYNQKEHNKLVAERASLLKEKEKLVADLASSNDKVCS